MSTSIGSKIIVQSLYRSLLKQSRIIDKSPINQCFLISKPKKIYIHEYGTPVSVRLYNTDFEIIERILNEYCGGEYFAPSYPNEESKSLQNIIKQYFRFGIPTKYDPLKILESTNKNESSQQILNKYLELAFYTKKRLSYSTNVINKRPFINDNNNNNNITNESENGKFTRMKLLSSFSLSSLEPLNNISNGSQLLDSKQISRGTLLISHPLSCLGQPDLYRKVIYIIENSLDRIVGITLNSAHKLFDDNTKQTQQNNNKNKNKNNNTMQTNEFEYCFKGWKGEYNYIGGPVNDQNCPFCILHKNEIFYNKFKESSTIIMDDTIYWTWVTGDNYQGVYHSLNQITQIIQYKNHNNKEISGKNHNNNETDAQIISETETETETETEIKDESNDENDIINNEFYESIMNDETNSFKFFQKYSYWSPEQLIVEIKNNVWFPAKLNDICEEKQLLNLKCPSTKLLGLDNNNKKGITDHKKQFNKWMWQAFIKGLGNEYKYLALFPDLNNEQTKEFYNFMEEFHNSWVPDVEHESFDSDDEPEEEGTDVW